MKIFLKKYLDKIFNRSNNHKENEDNFKANKIGLVVEASMERIVDGDTMVVRLKESSELITLRLLLIDTPEVARVGVSQPYAEAASNFAKEILKTGDSVYIEYDNEDKTDKYNRHLCYLWFYNEENGIWEMFNEVIIKKGLARVGYIYSQRKYLEHFYSIQAIAKEEKLNIWSIDGYVTDKCFNMKALKSR